MAEPTPSPWNGDENQNWRTAVDKWQWNGLDGGGWTKDGSCPSCKHGISITEIGEVIMTLDVAKMPDLEQMEKAEEGPIQAIEGEGKKFYARCNCGDPHPGRPPSLKTGCGSWAYIDPPPDEDQQ